jgi:hypothetical protein
VRAGRRAASLSQIAACPALINGLSVGREGLLQNPDA